MIYRRKQEGKELSDKLKAKLNEVLKNDNLSIEDFWYFVFLGFFSFDELIKEIFKNFIFFFYNIKKKFIWNKNMPIKMIIK